MVLPLLMVLATAPADLRAVGVVTSPHKERSVAVLASGGRTRLVAAGEAAFGGRVLEVRATSVAMVFDGTTVDVPLVAGTARAAAPPPVPSADPSPSPEGPGGLSLPRAEMDRRLGLELDRILAETALRPVTEGDQVRGLSLSRVAEGTLLTDAGLRAGDVLTEINGVAIDSLATLIGLYPRLQTESHVQATVVRNGETVALTLNLR
jgi:general secretion pathway protein C